MHNISYTGILFAIFLAVIITTTSVNAQNTKKFNVSINAGPTTALGQLGSQHYKSGGYALSGFNATAEGTLYFRPSLGVGIAFSETKFPFADGAFAHDKVNAESDLESLYLKSGPYQVRTLTAGIYYRRHISGRFSATGKLAGGVLWAQTPDQLFSASFYSVPNIGYKITTSHSTKATFQPGLSVRYQLFDHVDLTLNADYTLAVAAFGFQTSTERYVRKLTFSYLNSMIGINFKF